MTKTLFEAITQGMESEAARFHELSRETIDETEYSNMVFMILGLVILTTSLFLIIPTIYQISKANKMVISVFGYIPVEDIGELIYQSEAYLNIFLDERRYLDFE